MLAVFNINSKLILKEIASHYVTNAKQLSLIPIFKNSSYFSSLSTTPESLKTKTNSTESSNDSCSYTASYLMNSCGLSPEIAKSTSMKVNINAPERSDSVLELLKSHGFDETLISRLVQKQPKLLLSDPVKNLLPKLEFFHYMGLSKSDIGRVLSSNPYLLLVSLEKQLIPSYKFLKGVFHSDETMITLLQHRTSWIFYGKRNMVPNITYLVQHKVPRTSIKLLLSHYPMIILQKHEQFRAAVDKARAMGFDPLKCTFVLALRVLSQKSCKLIWNRCSEAYKKWGWSEDDIFLAFKKHPHCMILSEKKIDKAMDFFVNKMGYESKLIAGMPTALLYDVEKRIIPRCSVIQVLTSKGLVKKVSLCSVLPLVEKKFFAKFVTKYEDELPQLMSVYQQQISSLAS